MPSLLSARTARQIDRLRVDGFLTGRAVSDPQVDLVLYRDTDAGEAMLDAQAVVIAWQGQALATAGAEGALTAPTRATIRRPIALGFDVAVGDRFVTGGAAGAVTAVHQVNGMILADAEIDMGAA